MFFGVLVFLAPWAHAQSMWVLPLTLNDDNTEVRYSYDAFGRENTGKISGVRGKAWLHSSDPRSVRAQIMIPTPALNSIGGALLGPLAELLKSTRLPPVSVSVERFANLCLPQEVIPGRDCAARMEGRVNFGSVSRELRLPVTIQRKRDYFIVKGEGEVDTAVAQASAAGSFVNSASFAFSIQIPH